MTENEKYLEMPWNIEDTIENLKTIKEHFIATVLKANLDGKGKQDAKEVEFDFNRAIQALEEIQQYRAIGTVEEIKSEHKELIKLSRRYLKDTDELIKYQEIGTIEEFKQAMNFKKYFMELYGEGLEVANWHKNGDLEPLVNFIDEACN